MKRRDLYYEGNTSWQYYSTNCCEHTNCNGRSISMFPRLKLIQIFRMRVNFSRDGVSTYIYVGIDTLMKIYRITNKSSIFQRRWSDLADCQAGQTWGTKRLTGNGWRTGISSPGYQYEGPPISFHENFLLPSQQLQSFLVFEMTSLKLQFPMFL